MSARQFTHETAEEFIFYLFQTGFWNCWYWLYKLLTLYVGEKIQHMNASE